jgi:hypothetical protein
MKTPAPGLPAVRRFVVCLLLVIGLGLPGAGANLLAQSAPTLGPNDALSFDYLDADFATYQVSSFQASWDGGAWVALTATPFKDAITTTGATSYKFLTPFTNGTHTVSVRACNSVGCGGGSSPFAFAVLVVSPTPAPGNLRKVAR